MGESLNAKRARRAYASTPEWYTPRWLKERISAFYGGAYFDPCPARQHDPIATNGLALPWRGQVFVNPPYGRDIEPWIRKAMTEPVRELILLVPNSTGSAWFEPLFAHPICFVHGRIYFEGRDGKTRTRSPGDSVLVYRGERRAQFAEAFADLGPIMQQMRARQTRQPELWTA